MKTKQLLLMHKNIKWGNKELKELSFDELNKLTADKISRIQNGKNAVESGQLGRAAKMGGETMGPKHYKNGTALFARSEEKIKEDSSKGGKQCWNDKLENGTSNEHIEKMVEKSLESENHINNQKILCPNCNKEFIGRIYYRWHGDNCNQLEIYKKQLDIILKLEKDTFDANDLVYICLKEDYDRKKFYYRNGLLKNKKYIKCIKKGTNQNNPSLFKILKKTI